MPVTDFIVSNNILLGTFLQLGGSFLGMAGHLGKYYPIALIDFCRFKETICCIYCKLVYINRVGFFYHLL